MKEELKYLSFTGCVASAIKIELLLFDDDVRWPQSSMGRDRSYLKKTRN